MKRRRKSPIDAAAGIRLPPNISFRRDVLPEGMAYVFRHTELGELGRMCVTGTASGETYVLTEAVGDEREPLFAQRRALLASVSQEISAALESIGGPGRTSPPPLPAPHATPVGTLPVEEVPCDRCGALVALLVFVENATDQGRFEDGARLMYPHYAATTAHTYLIGPEQGDAPGNYRAPILKVWPQREPMRTWTPEAVRAHMEQQIKAHCR